MKSIANLLNEIGMLSHIPRSGFAFLGAGKQSVAEHSFRVALIAHVLARLIKVPVDHDKLMMICLLHDLPESRTGDLNYMQKKYVNVDKEKVLKEIKTGSSLGSEIVSWIEEYENGDTIESQLAHDADHLELMLVLKKELGLEDEKAAAWFKKCFKKLKTQEAKDLAKEIEITSSDDWWFSQDA